MTFCLEFISMPLGIGYGEHFIFVLGTVILYSCQYIISYTKGSRRFRWDLQTRGWMSFEGGATPGTICNQKDFLEVAVYAIILEVSPPLKTGNDAEGRYCLIVRTVRRLEWWVSLHGEQYEVSGKWSGESQETHSFPLKAWTVGLGTRATGPCEWPLNPSGQMNFVRVRES